MSTLYPAGIWRPLGPQTAKPLTKHDIICLHTMVGGLVGTDGYFQHGNGEGYRGTESHFGVGGSTDGRLDGAVYQWQRLDRRADANYEGNGRVISIETSDGGNHLRRWSPAQVDAIVDLIVWLCREYDIPPVLIPDTKPGRRGIGWHAQGIEPNLVNGGECWSTARGKVCPGHVRIAQLKDEVMPRVRARMAGEPAKPKTVKVKAATTLAALAASLGLAVAALAGANPTVTDPAKPLTPGTVVTVPPTTVTVTPKPSSSKASRPTLRVGSKGTAVRTLQRALGVSVDGVFGGKTKTAVIAYQRSRGLPADGVVGAKTWAKIDAKTPAAKTTTKPKPKATTKPKPKRPVVKVGSRGAAVRVVQGAVKVGKDGVFGARTKAAVKKYQRAHKLTADGVVGAKTWAVIDK